MSEYIDESFKKLTEGKIKQVSNRFENFYLNYLKDRNSLKENNNLQYNDNLHEKKKSKKSKKSNDAEKTEIIIEKTDIIEENFKSFLEKNKHWRLIKKVLQKKDQVEKRLKEFEIIILKMNFSSTKMNFSSTKKNIFFFLSERICFLTDFSIQMDNKKDYIYSNDNEEIYITYYPKDLIKNNSGYDEIIIEYDNCDKNKIDQIYQKLSQLDKEKEMKIIYNRLIRKNDKFIILLKIDPPIDFEINRSSDL